jgi:lipoic acid synthetase
MARELPVLGTPTGAAGVACAPTPAAPVRRHPEWIRSKVPSGDNYQDLRRLLGGLDLNTVCAEARCPNVGECWDQRTATIMILGETCTRACGFCAVKTGRPTWFDDDEPRRVAEALSRLDLDHVVITSVARDDLPDEGAGAFAETIRQLRTRCPEMGIEVLIPDFNGREDLLRTVMDAAPDILDHNVETVERLQKPVRKRARYDRSLDVLARAKAYAVRRGIAVHTKSSVMVGLGEDRAELTRTFADLRAVDCDILTIGQYLQPTPTHLPVQRYYHPDEFAEMNAEGLALGFRHVESGPLVRTSYHARGQVPGAELRELRRRATLDASGRVVPVAD